MDTFPCVPSTQGLRCLCVPSVLQMIYNNCADQPSLKRPPSSVSQVFLPGFLSSNLYYKYLNDLIHSVRGDEFPGGNIALSIHGPGSSPDSDSLGGPDGSVSQVYVLGLVLLQEMLQSLFCINIKVPTL